MVARVFSLILLLLIFYNSVLAQKYSPPLYMPLEYQQAYTNNTRSFTGEPGAEYWQNKATYKINASLDPIKKQVKGSAIIQYQNNSPDTIPYLVIRLHQDMYKKGAARDREIDPEDVTNGIDLISVRVNKDKINLSNRSLVGRFGTNVYINIKDGLKPGKDVRLELEWQVDLPKKTLIRMGTIKNNTMFVAYWYPQVSVYDDVDGWDRFNYGSRQEFYQQTADFDVDISLPAGYAVWATGTLNNPDERYTSRVNQVLAKAMQSDSVYQVFGTPEEGLADTKGIVTWSFSANKVPDFAFAVSDEYRWDAGSVMVDSVSQRRILVHTVYDRAVSSSYQQVTRYQQLSMQYFSFVFPGYPYPYTSFTTFQGLNGGGMEFPMMANNGTYTNRDSQMIALQTIEVTAHEIAHSYFPFLVGVNERKNTWLEEGWATFLGEQATAFIQPQVGLSTNYSMNQRYRGRFFRTEGTIMSVPAMIPSILVREAWSHFHVSYYKTYFAWVTLRDLLGKEIFNRVMKAYIQRWQYKSPTPYDFFYTVNDVSGMDLNWFWNAWFFEFGYPDVAVTGVDKHKIYLENIGRLPVPLTLRVVYANNQMKQIPVNTSAWAEDIHKVVLEVPDLSDIIRVEILDFEVPDINPVNNYWEIDKQEK